MRRLIVLLLLLANIVTTFGQQKPKGITFFEGNWKDLLATAQKRRLPVFVDVYTDWCGPCKRMEKEIFGLPEVGSFYNANYISYRLNAEKGEGPALARKYGVNAYPTWLFLDADGTLRDKRTDFMEAVPFINAAKTALGKDSTSAVLASLEQRFKSGSRDRPFLQNYLAKRAALQLDNAYLLDAYVTTLNKADISLEDLRLLLRYSGRTWSTAIPLITKELYKFGEVERHMVANTFFDKHLYFVWGDAIKNKDKESAEQIRKMGAELYPMLDKNQQLNFDHTALYHCMQLMTTEGLKEVAYRIAAGQMAEDTLKARQKDKELLTKVMEPFLSGKQDSTKIPGFSEEKKLAARQYSSKIAVLLYEAAKAFADLLPPKDPVRKDAFQWAVRADQLAPNSHTRALIEKLRSKN